MPTIAIQRRHQLDSRKAKAAAKKIAADLAERYQLVCAWDGDRVSFERTGISGTMHVGKNELRLDVRLSFLMTPLKGPIEQAIHKELDELLGHKA